VQDILTLESVMLGGEPIGGELITDPPSDGGKTTKG
jgi:hypothetical protein